MKDINLKLVFGTIVGAVLLMVVVWMLFDALAIGTYHEETFEVTDPGVDQINTLEATPDGSTVVVEQWNGVSWSTIGSGYITVNGNVVTVDDEPLYG